MGFWRRGCGCNSSLAHFSTFPFVDGLYNRQQSTPALKSKDSQTDNFVHKD